MTKDSRKKRTALAQIGGPAIRSGDEGICDWLAFAADVTDADRRALTHGFHTWPARMHPLTAKRLIAKAPPGRIADPFMGGGTVVVESIVAGRRVVGRDLNPVALEVAWARTRCWSKRQCDGLLFAAEQVVRWAKEHRPPGNRVPKAFFAEEGAWYDPPALVDLWCLQKQIGFIEDPEMARMLRVVLSSVAVKASRQASDSVTRVDRDHQFIPGGRLLGWFVARAREHSENLARLARAIPEHATPPTLQIADSRQPFEHQRGDDIVLVCTSPPYPGTYDYVEHHRRRYGMFDADPEQAERLELGSRREQRELGPKRAALRYEEDMANALEAWKPALAADARVVMVVGDGQAPGGGVIKVTPLIEAAAQRAGFVVLGTVSQRRPTRGHTSRSGAGRPAHRKGAKPAPRHKFEHFMALGIA